MRVRLALGGAAVARARGELFVGLRRLLAGARALVGIRVRAVERRLGPGPLADRIGPVRSGTLQAPRLAFDLNHRVVRTRNDAVEGRANRPAIDDGRDVEVALDRDMEEAPIDGGRDATCKPASDAREHRPGSDVAAHTHPQLAIEIRGRQPEASRAGYTQRARQSCPC